MLFFKDKIERNFNLSRETRIIYRFLKKKKMWYKASDISNEVNLDFTSVCSRLKYLYSIGIIQKKETNKNDKWFTYYKIRCGV